MDQLQTLKSHFKDLEQSNPASDVVEAFVEISTLKTSNEQRDTHLKSADFFDLEQFPQMSYKSSNVEKKGEEEYSVTGSLTLHGITQPVTFAVEGPSKPAKDPGETLA